MNGEPKLAGVIGWPIGHSKSPVLHGYWLKRYGISGQYVPISLRPEKVEEALRGLGKIGFRGVNVTIPHKETAMALADSVSETAGILGAANTLTFDRDGGFHADNTDGYGFVSSLKQECPDWDAKETPALVLGAGGASRAIVGALLNEGASEIRLANRTRQRAVELREHFGTRVTVCNWRDICDAVSGAKTIVNTTSLGMAGKPAVAISLDAADDDALVTDIVYQPLITPLLAAAKARDLHIVDGLGMLLHQAAPGFERWFGQWPQIDDEVRSVVLEAQ